MFPPINLKSKTFEVSSKDKLVFKETFIVEIIFYHKGALFP